MPFSGYNGCNGGVNSGVLSYGLGFIYMLFGLIL